MIWFFLAAIHAAFAALCLGDTIQHPTLIGVMATIILSNIAIYCAVKTGADDE